MQQNGSAQNGSSRAKIEPQYVRFVGDSVGVVNLTPAALQYLSDRVSDVLLRAMNTGKEYALHGRRSKLTGDDIEEALKRMRMTVPFGASSRRGPQLRQFTMANGEELYVRDEYDMDVNAVVDESKPKYPLQPHLKAHWLAFEGKLALVPENVRPVKEDEEEDDVVPANEQAKAASIVTRRETAGGSVGASVSFRATSRVVQTKENIQIKAPIVEPLSVEQQQYIKEIVEAIVGQDDNRRQSALTSLEVDTGIQPILPKFSRLVHHGIRCNVLAKSMSMLIYMVRIIRALSANTSLKLIGVLHELIPSLISCMVGRSLCRTVESDNHWALRDFSAKTLIPIIKANNVGDVTERTLRVIRKVWEDPESSYPMLYGCVHILLELTPPRDPFRVEMLQKVIELQQTMASKDPESLTPAEKAEQAKMHTILNRAQKYLSAPGSNPSSAGR